MTQPADDPHTDDWLDAHDQDPNLHLNDLKGQGASTIRLYTMTDIQPGEDYL
ncbi:SET domain-containing protein [Streptomyces sp. ID01-12c]|nr:SET domain-containing protein [Streptomyces caniscabiei]